MVWLFRLPVSRQAWEGLCYLSTCFPLNLSACSKKKKRTHWLHLMSNTWPGGAILPLQARRLSSSRDLVDTSWGVIIAFDVHKEVVNEWLHVISWEFNRYYIKSFLHFVVKVRKSVLSVFHLIFFLSSSSPQDLCSSVKDPISSCLGSHLTWKCCDWTRGHFTGLQTACTHPSLSEHY